MHASENNIVCVGDKINHFSSSFIYSYICISRQKSKEGASRSTSTHLQFCSAVTTVVEHNSPVNDDNIILLKAFRLALQI